MKQLFYFLSIIFTSGLFGQNLIKNYEIGYYADYDKVLINGYYDFDYQPKTKLSITYETNENFTDGYLIDKTDSKRNGLLKYSQLDRELKFKKSKDDAEKSVKADHINGYVIGIDTFSVVKNVLVIGPFGEKLSNKGEFAESIETISGMRFYKFTSLAANGTSYSKYIVKTSATSDYRAFPSRKSKFIEMASEIFGNDPILKSNIENGKYTEKDIPSILKIVKYKSLHNKNQNILFNSLGDETNNTNESVYFSKIESIKDSVFHLSYSFKNNMKIYEGDFTSFYPHKKQGDFLFYHPNESIRKKIVYNFKNEPKKAIDYFENGKIHRQYNVLEDGTILYNEIYNTENNNILSERGNGKELFTDPFTNRTITYEYENKKLKYAFFTNENGEKIYQVCENNAELKKIKSLQKTANEKLKYPIESLQNNTHGYVLIRCIVEPSGLVSEVTLVKGLDTACDNATLEFLTCFKNEIYWKPGKVNDEAVKQEIIFPIDFSIHNSSSYRNNYYNSWFINNMMMQQNMINQQNTMMNKIPSGRF